MQQPCHRCGYESDRPTRFCRQCGERLFVENEATSAPTRQQPPQQSSNPYDAPYQSQLAQAQAAPGGRFDNQTPDTSRLYHTPMAPKLPSYPANYQPAEAKKSGAWKWVLIALLCAFVISGGIGAMVVSSIREKQFAADRAIKDILQHAARVKEEMDRMEQEGRLAPPPPPPPSSAESLESGEGLERYKYPGAKVKDSVSVMGNDVVEMITTDSVSDVREYYKKQLGDSIIKEENNNAVTLTIFGSPMIVVKINKDKQDSNNTIITLVRTNFRVPKWTN